LEQNIRMFSLETGHLVAVAELEPNEIKQMFTFPEIILAMFE